MGLKHLIHSLAAVAIVLHGGVSDAAGPAGPWVRTRTTHFLVEGNAAAEELRTVATRLEQFHAVVATAARGSLVTVAPTVVTVLADADSMSPFLPSIPGGAGKLAGFITTTPIQNRLVIDASSGALGYQQVYREYARQLLDGLFSAPPPWWVSEGLAQFYSTFVVSPDGTRAELGQPVGMFPVALAERMEPVTAVVGATTEAVTSLDPAARERYTAVAWGLMHYMLIENSTRRAQLTVFMDKLSAGLTREAAFTAAFAADPAVLERELQQHLKAGGLFRVRTVPVAAQGAPAPEPMTESEIEATTGRMLTESGNHATAETRVRRALALDARNAAAHTALGLLQLRTGKVAEAVGSLRHAALLAPDDGRAQLALGYGAIRQVDEGGSPAELQAAVATARAALGRALELDPDRPVTLSLLAYALASGNEDLARAETLLTRAIALVPARDDYRLTLVELLIQQQQYDQAKTIAARLVQSGATAARRQRANALLAEIRTRESVAARKSVSDDEAARRGAAAAGIGRGSGKSHVVLDLRRPDEGEQQTRGQLIHVECPQGRVIIHVLSGGKTWKFAAAAFEEVELLTYRDDGAPQVGCGPARVKYPVILTWRKPAAGEATPTGIDGMAVALEVLPDGMEGRDDEPVL